MGHNVNDIDVENESVHHTLGLFRGQALPGDVLSSITFTGAAPVSAFDLKVLEALVLLGATDATT